MSKSHCEPLSGQDNAFLLWETPNLHMHVSATQLYELGPLAGKNGGVCLGVNENAH